MPTRPPPGLQREIDRIIGQLGVAIQEAKVIFNSNPSWLLAGSACLGELIEAVELPTGVTIGLAAGCFAKLVAVFVELNKNKTIQEIQRLLSRLESLVGIGGPSMALPNLATPPVCSTGNPRHKGICCAALTQLGAAQAATGFTFTSCTGHTVCMKCGVGKSISTNPARRGQPIFIPRRVSCGPSGCPALLGQ